MVLAKFFARTRSAISLVCAAACLQAFAAEPVAQTNSVKQELNNGITYWLDTTFSNKKVHIVQIDLTNPKVKFRASASQERGMTPSEFAAKTGAIAVINGDFFDAAQRTIGLAAGLGSVWPNTADTKEWSFLACADNNSCFIDPYKTVTPHQPAWTSVVGGWQLLIDPDFEWSKAEDSECGDFCLVEHPRTAVGLNSDRSKMWWVMVEGRQGPLTGLSLANTTRIFKKLGATWALNMDGGGSSGLILNGRRINGRPFNEPQERRVANCLAVISRP